MTEDKVRACLKEVVSQQKIGAITTNLQCSRKGTTLKSKPSTHEFAKEKRHAFINRIGNAADSKCEDNKSHLRLYGNSRQRAAGSRVLSVMCLFGTLCSRSHLDGSVRRCVYGSPWFTAQLQLNTGHLLALSLYIEGVMCIALAALTAHFGLCMKCS